MRLEITTTLAPRGPAGAIVLDDDQVAQIGGGAKVFPVRVTVNDRAARLRLARMGGESLIGFSKQVRAELGVEIGDQVHAVIERDDAPREIAIPEELQQALDADPAAKAAFDKLAPSHRKEHARAIAEAKRPETRAKRVAATIEALRTGS
ncbi:YdeI/OmpD-associated family protein [Solirubrobacter taibaiensis]|nr:YdeI/OmpD-associated family protein [Solirubrobacter taibaiensis]